MSPSNISFAPMISCYEMDPFDVDKIRHECVREQKIEQFKETYKEGLYPELPEMSTASVWDDLALQEEVPDFRVRRLRAAADLIPQRAKILDIGVGWGEIVPMIIAKGERKYVGIDFSKGIVETAANKYPDCTFIHGDISKIDDSFDVVLALEVCEHIVASKIMHFYEHIKRVLRNDGLFIVSVPVYENLKGSTLKCPNCGHWHNRVGHVRAYTPEVIKAELTSAGFNVLDSSFIYLLFGNNWSGKIKRKIVDLGRSLLRLGLTTPLNIIVLAKKAA